MSETTRQRTGLLGLARLLALAVAGLAGLIYLLGFSGEVAPMVTSQSGLLLIGGGVLAGFATLPRAPRLLLPAVALVVLGALDLLVLVSTDLVQLSGVAIVATVLAVLELGVAIVALLVDQGVLRPETLSGGRLGQPPSPTGAGGAAGPAGATAGMNPPSWASPTSPDARTESFTAGHPPGWPAGSHPPPAWSPPTGWAPPGWGPPSWAPVWGPPVWPYSGASAPGQSLPGQWLPGQWLPGHVVPGQPPVPGQPARVDRDPEQPSPHRSDPEKSAVGKVTDAHDPGEAPASGPDGTRGDEPDQSGMVEPGGAESGGVDPGSPAPAGTGFAPDLVASAPSAAAVIPSAASVAPERADRPGDTASEAERFGRPR